ncbi:MAG TPA: TetR/AcrR family transcriptional regulator [Streptomyces sp.]|uniref:TetR/AcrR family transcriptional regulator n=1 Tax=Streptomyces sp. TaxID=1931 RepID=UPI002D679E73|nr:TetR/AcrR family transcriptional regulator [Streptomyces sp.]HZG05152.1 TetR/AcrR family transcriptional regulator [Streptomyces sp.]
MTTQRRTPDASRRSQATRRAILDAALELVGEVGYARLSIEGIAARAGAGKQTIYRWWPSKGAVLVDALLMLSEGRGEGAAELPDTGDLEADLKTVLRATVEELNDPRLSEPMRALTVEVLLDPDLAAVFAERLDRPVRELKLRRLRAARDAGQLAPGVDLEVAVDMIWGPLHRRWLHREGPLTAGFADAVVEAALNGLRPRPHGGSPQGGQRGEHG